MDFKTILKPSPLIFLLILTQILLSVNPKDSFFSIVKSKSPKKKMTEYQTDPQTTKVVNDAFKLSSAKKNFSRLTGFVKILKRMAKSKKKFESKIRAKLNGLESVFLAMDKEIEFYKAEILKHNSLLHPCQSMLNEAQGERHFLQRYRYSAGIGPEMIAIMDMLDKRIETLKEVMPMDVPLKQIIEELLFKWHDQVMPRIRGLSAMLFEDMNMLNRVVDFMKNDVDQIDLQEMVRPVLNPFIDFYGNRVVKSWGSEIEELDDFKNKIYIPFDTYTVVYFSVRESIIETVINSVKPFLQNLKPTA